MSRRPHDRSVSMGQTVGSPLPENTPRGAFFLTHSDGWVSRSISAAQAFTRGGSYWTHAGLYIGEGRIVHAEPKGVRVRRFDDWYWQDGVPRELLVSDAPVRRHLAANPGADEGSLRQEIVQAAMSLEGSPYSWMAYLRVAAVEFNWPGVGRMTNRISTRGTIICSAMVDQALALAGVHLFTDDRIPGDVTPGDLARYDEAWVRDRVTDLERRVSTIEERLDAA